MTDEETQAMSDEEWLAFTKTLPCAVVDFRNCDPLEDEDEQLNQTASRKLCPTVMLNQNTK